MAGDGDQQSGQDGGTWTPYDASGPAASDTPDQPPTPPPHVPYGTPDHSTQRHQGLQRYQGTSRRNPLGAIIGVIAGAAAIAGVGVAIAAFSGSDPDATNQGLGSGIVADPGEPQASEAAEPDVLSVSGFEDLRAAIKEKTGRTEVFDATLFGTYGSVTVPEDATSQRERRLYWNGVELEDDDNIGTAGEPRADLAKVDPERMVRLVRRVTRLVEDPTGIYVIIRGPINGPEQKDGEMLAYATNEYGETAYLSATLDGTVVRRYVSTEE